MHTITRPCKCTEQVTGGPVHQEKDRVAIGPSLIGFVRVRVRITEHADACVHWRCSICVRCKTEEAGTAGQMPLF